MKIKSILIVLLLTVSTTVLIAQTENEKPRLYNPEANAKQDIANAVSLAKKEGKQVFLQIGGNWCVWCLRFNKLIVETPELTKMMDDNYVVVHVNYSPENKNEEVLASLDYPQRFGFPVFLILDANGKRLHTQNSAYLEEGNGHSQKLIAEFLKSWTKKALEPASYIKN
jgi:thioredoxin-related protein